MSTETVQTARMDSPPKKRTIPDLQKMKQQGEKITMLTAYDYPSALLLDQAGIDTILVGDSLGMVVLGYENTLAVTMEDMLHHCKAVARGAKKAFLIGDMPFMSYQVTPADGVRNAGRFLQEAGMDAVKLEGGRERLETIKAIRAAGIPVMGHIGLTPQSIRLLGGFKLQGKTAQQAQRVLEDALLLQDAGCFSLVLEAVPDNLAAYITDRLDIPTIGIGAGAGCDGQVLVLHDVLGLFDRFTPRFARQYTNLSAHITQAVQSYYADVRGNSFPGSEHSTHMAAQEWEQFLREAE